jgi:hypothetical protein
LYLHTTSEIEYGKKAGRQAIDKKTLFCVQLRVG